MVLRLHIRLIRPVPSCSPGYRRNSNLTRGTVFPWGGCGSPQCRYRLRRCGPSPQRGGRGVRRPGVAVCRDSEPASTPLTDVVRALRGRRRACVQGGGVAGHQLELACGLVHQEVEAADHGVPGPAGGGGQRGGPRAVDDVEDAAGGRKARASIWRAQGSAAPAGTVEMSSAGGPWGAVNGASVTAVPRRPGGRQQQVRRGRGHAPPPSPRRGRARAGGQGRAGGGARAQDEPRGGREGGG